MIDQSLITINENHNDHNHDLDPQSIVEQSVDDHMLNDDFASSNICDST